MCVGTKCGAHVRDVRVRDVRMCGVCVYMCCGATYSYRCDSFSSSGTWALLAEFFPQKCGITCTFVDITDAAAVAGAFTAKTKVVYTESMSNPTLRVADLPMLADVAHAHGCTFVVDNTFTPLAITPADHGTRQKSHCVLFSVAIFSVWREICTLGHVKFHTESVGGAKYVLKMKVSH